MKEKNEQFIEIKGGDDGGGGGWRWWWSKMMMGDGDKRLKITFIILIYLKLYLGFKLFKILTPSTKTSQLQQIR